MKNEPGVLYSILQPFAARGLNMTKIESRPTKRRPWEYVNFVDFEGHRDTDDVRAGLDEVAERCQCLKILRSYPPAQGAPHRRLLRIAPYRPQPRHPPLPPPA